MILLLYSSGYIFSGFLKIFDNYDRELAKYRFSSLLTKYSTANKQNIYYKVK